MVVVCFSDKWTLNEPSMNPNEIPISQSAQGVKIQYIANPSEDTMQMPQWQSWQQYHFHSEMDMLWMVP